MAAQGSLLSEDRNRRLDALVVRAQALEVDGLPFPIQQVREAITEAVAIGAPQKADQVLKRGEALLDKVSRDWTWVKELLRRADELRAIAGTIGVDLALLDSRVGNPRMKLRGETLSAGSLEKAAASASLALAVLNDAVPKFCVQQAQQLGESIRAARDRGEDVVLPAASFSRLLQAIQDQNLPTAAQRLVEARKAVARIPRAPALPTRMSDEEEEEILLEARNLARRLQRIKGKAHDAHSAARLMSQGTGRVVGGSSLRDPRGGDRGAVVGGGPDDPGASSGGRFAGDPGGRAAAGRSTRLRRHPEGRPARRPRRFSSRGCGVRRRERRAERRTRTGLGERGPAAPGIPRPVCSARDADIDRPRGLWRPATSLPPSVEASAVTL